MLEQVSPSCAQHGEGPIWDQAEGRLIFVDLLRGDLLTLDGRGGQPQRTDVGDVVACVAPRRGGGLVVANERNFTLIDESGGFEVLTELWQDQGVRMNDGGCDPAGRFFCGSMAYDERPDRGALWCLEPTSEATVVFDHVSISNGLGWAPDGNTAYYIDSPTQRIDALDYELATGTFAERRTFVDIPSEVGMPDGLTVDAEGGVWVALWGGSAVRRYDADGKLDVVLELPTTHPTSCALGGPDLDELFVTTSTLGPGTEDDPCAGAVFWMQTSVRGLPCAAFDG